MQTLDETDHEILRLLVEDARRPYSDIADRVGLSGPTISDRVDRLEDLGVIQQFTVDVDRTRLSGGVPVLVDVAARPGRADDVREHLVAHDDVEHVFATADARVVATATVPQGAAGGLLSDLAPDAVRGYEVDVLDDAAWTPRVGADAFAIECDECGNSVTEEGVATTLDGDRYHFCCPSCRDNFVARYEELQEGAT